MSQRVGRLSGTLYSGPFLHGHSGMVRKHQTSDAQLRIGESRDSGLREPVIGRAQAWSDWQCRRGFMLTCCW
jgi:hypothetical protein